MKIDTSLTVQSLEKAARNVFAAAGPKAEALHQRWQVSAGAPVFTIEGKYTARGWTEWTQGFQFGASILLFDVTGDEAALKRGREATVRHMAPHISHIGVHDHGFNNVSTYGNLLRLAGEKKIEANEWEVEFYRLALKLSGAIQAARWTDLPDGLGYIYSFNGPHSLFSDTVRSLRALAVAHQLGHRLMGERDRKISLLERLVQHSRTTAKYNVYFGEKRDTYDVPGRVVHESIFNLNDGSYRCPSSQQGYSPFTTWTRGHAWILCGYAEELEFLETLSDEELAAFGGKESLLREFQHVAETTAEFYLSQTPLDGIPYWDTGAPGLAKMGDYLARSADPFNEHEPVDSSAAAIAAQGLYRLGKWLESKGEGAKAERYVQAALTVARTLFTEPYLSTDPQHEGLLLHSVYHWPNGWDHVPTGKKIPCGEACQWGDYHLLELALLIHREARHEPYLKFFL
jgi:hypothetical protein